MTTNVWGCDHRFCISDYAFSDYQTRNEHRKLLQAYKNADMKQFHSMNAGTLELTKTSVFYSYYTELARLLYNAHTEHFMLLVSPFIYDTNAFINSRTSNRQLNRWLYEKGLEIDVHRIRDYYTRACKSDIGNASENFSKIYAVDPQNRTHDAIPVTLRFLNEQHRLKQDGSFECKITNARVPVLAYNTSDTHMFKIGTFIHRSNEFGLSYVRN